MNIGKWFKNIKFIYKLLGGYIIFAILPMTIVTIYNSQKTRNILLEESYRNMAFINYSPKGNGYFADLFQSEFVGFDWFRYFFQTDFFIIMRNTLATSLLTLLISFPLPILLAVCLNELKKVKIKKFVQTVSYLPYFISWVIAANIFITFLSSNGVVNKILLGLGLVDQEILFFQQGPYFWWIIAIANAWKVMGYNAIIYLAAISGIGQDMYEAADVDGATRVQKIFHITLPSLMIWLRNISLVPQQNLPIKVLENPMHGILLIILA